MTGNKPCPSCGAALTIKVIGDLHDKVYCCEYCGHQEDLPDEVRFEQHEEDAPFKDSMGNVVRRVRKVIIHRKDGPVSPDAPLFDPSAPAGENAQWSSLGGDPSQLVKKIEQLSGSPLPDEVKAVILDRDVKTVSKKQVWTSTSTKVETTHLEAGALQVPVRDAAMARSRSVLAIVLILAGLILAAAIFFFLFST